MLSALQVEKIITKRISELKKEKQKIEESLKKSPEGKIHIAKRGKHVSYYFREYASAAGGKYISKTRKKFIKKLLQKSYDEKVLKQIDFELRILEKMLDRYLCREESLRNIYDKYPEESQEMITPIDISDKKYIEMWCKEEYQGKEISLDGPDYITNRGERVRSKSEINIANLLDSCGVLYKYERPLRLNSGNVIYPDFTILDIKRRKVIYWEHRGMMDNPNYAIHSVWRIKEYEKNNIFLGDDLIITEECSENPLGIVEIQRIIKHYFL